MRTQNGPSLVVALMLVSASIAAAQSLPDVAKAEKARRAKIRSTGEPAKLYTEGDRSGMATEPSGSQGQATDDSAAPAPTGSVKKSKEKTPEELAAEKQKDWAERVKKAQDEIKSAEDVLVKNERSLASMYNVTPARADMAAAVESDKKKIATLKQALVDLEEERRRAGMPRLR